MIRKYLYDYREDPAQLAFLREAEKPVLPLVLFIMVPLLVYVNLPVTDIASKHAITVLALLGIIHSSIYQKIIVPSNLYNRYWMLMTGIILSALAILGCIYTGWLLSPWIIILYMINTAIIATIAPNFPAYIALFQTGLLAILTIIQIYYDSLSITDPFYTLMRIVTPLFFGFYIRDNMLNLAAKSNLLSKSYRLVKKLKRERLKLNTVFQATSEAIVVLNLRKRVILHNKKAKDLLPHIEVGSNLDIQSINPDMFKINQVPLENTDNEYIGTIIIIKSILETQELERMRLDFVSMAAHKLRTPVTNLKGYSSLIIDDEPGNLSVQQREVISRINQNSILLANLIEQIIESTKIEEKINKNQ